MSDDFDEYVEPETAAHAFRRRMMHRAIDRKIEQAAHLKAIERELCGVQTLKERRRLAQEYIDAYDEATKL